MYSGRKILMGLLFLLCAMSSMVILAADTTTVTSVSKSKSVSGAGTIKEVGPFTAINVVGNIHLTLQNTVSQPTYLVKTASTKEQSYDIFVDHNTLYINQVHHRWNKKQPVEISVEVSSALKNIVASGQVSVTTDKLNLPKLIVGADSSSAITLSGKFGLYSLVATGPGKVKVDWVDTPNLTVLCSDSGNVVLAGTVDTMQADIKGHCVMDAQYLRVKTLLNIKTDDFAKALVLPIGALRAYARGNSNVYYYKKPKHITKSTYDSANVLQLDWRS